MNGFAAACERLLSRLGHALEHHPRQATAAIAAFLLCGGGAAFGVATLDPSPEHIVVRQVLEEVAPLAIDAQLAALENHDLNLFRSDATRASESVEALLARLGVDDAAAASFLRREPTFRRQLMGRSGRSVTVETNERRELVKLTARWVPDTGGSFTRLVVDRAAGGVFVSHVETAPLVASVRLGSAVVRTSLFGAADDAHVPDAVVTQMVEIFSSEIDFHRDLRMGDRFDVVYETLEADGEPVRTGRILSVEFINAGTRYNALWFQAAGRKGAYFTLDGKSLTTSYLAAPLEFSRVSSGFATRFHPIQHQWKAHLGVDYAARIGTPVRTVGEGTVEFAGVQNGFGNVVIVKHGNLDQTLYAHLSRVAVRAGQAVTQGQTIGSVGQTGWATGPHLHFEFRVNGVHQNPTLMAKRAEATTLSAELRPDFDRLARSMRLQLAAAAREVQLAGN
ncbi:M23 family metallopeptidase [Ramlibacter sp. PS4R-6]|uniref:M23 family metallopeptidase n=1 Tax=Ramlibacter sp. PS4R-6 TaxID=3133438 RepID=UPI0030AD5814